MTEPLPKNVRQAGYNALEELSNRMLRGATSLLKHAARLRTEDAACHREAIAQLRRYRGFKMPCSEQVRVIEGALLSLTEADSKALEERRRIEKMHKDAAERESAERIRRKYEKAREPTLADAARLQSALNAFRDRARALEPSAERPQDGNVIAGPWDAGGEARP